MISLHFLNIFVFVAQILYVCTILIYSKKYRFNVTIKNYLTSAFIIILSLLSWAFLLYLGFDLHNFKSPHLQADFIGGVSKIINYFSFDILSELPLEKNIGIYLRQLSGLLLMLILFFYGIYICFKKDKNAPSVILCLYWFLIPVILIVSISTLGYFKLGYFNSPAHLIKVRYVLSSAVPYYILIARGVSGMRGKYFFYTLAIFSIISSLTLKQYYAINKKSDWAKAFDYINNRITSAEMLTCITDRSRPRIPIEFCVCEYYSRHECQLVDPGKAEEISNNYLVSGIWQLWWNNPVSAQSIIERYLANKFYIEEIKQIDNIKIFHFRKK